MPCSRLEERDPARPKDELGTLRLANADPPVLGEQPCFALPCDQGAPSGAGYGRLRVLALPCARSGGSRRPGTAPRPPLLCLCSTYIHDGCCQFNEGILLVTERAGGRRPKFALCYTHLGPYEPSSSSCARRPAPSACQVESTCAARVISPTSSRASAARLNGAVRALAKARPLLCAAAACLACTHAHHYYDCLSLFLHRPLCVLLLHPRPVIPPPPSPTLPPRHALTGYACAPPANILRGW